MNPIRTLRFVESAYKPIRILNAWGALTCVMITFVSIAPFCIKELPFMLWTPFDPFARFSTYITLYLLEVMCAIFSGAMATCANWFILLVLICSKYNFEVLGARVARIGHQASSQKDMQNGAYGEMIELVKLHMKMNR